MDLEQLRRDLDLIAHAFDHRTQIWRIIVGKDGHEVRRIYSGSFLVTARATPSVPHSTKGDNTS